MTPDAPSADPDVVDPDPPAGAGEDASGAEPDFGELAATLRERIEADASVRRRLPGEGRVHLDRALPFLLVHRSLPGHSDPATGDLVSGSAAYLRASGEERYLDGLRRLVRAVGEAAVERLGGFLLAELWTLPCGDVEPPDPDCPPEEGAARPVVLKVVADGRASEVADRMVRGLETLRLRSPDGGELGVRPRPERVERLDASPRPADLEPLWPDPPDEVSTVGVEVSAFFRHPSTAEPYPRVVQALRREVTRVLEEVAFDFALERTSLDPPHPRALGRRNVGRAATHVDRRLGEVYGAFDPLLQVTPVNTEEAWEAFRQSGFERAPELRYRPLPMDPEDLKGRLFHVPIGGVEDPLLARLFREKQQELDRQITMVTDRGTPRFRFSSVAIHGGVSADLRALAQETLEALPPGDGEEYREEGADPDTVDAEEFAERASGEIDHYRRMDPAFTGGVRMRDDVTAGLMVSKGVLMVSRGLRIPRERMEALIHHEVGTHVVTYCNGTRQPLRLFASGLAGYEPLQEGLAVLSEYLVGGLTRQRMRILAVRVLAVDAMLGGAGFVDTFRLCRDEHGFGDRTSFIVAVRVHRGGGHAKDAAYLRGLRDLLAYLREEDAALDPLFVGKVGMAHTDAVQELVLRGVLRLPMVKPRYTSDLPAMERLGACRNMTVPDLVRAIGEGGEPA